MVGIGFFAPFPLALMVPFMAGQSLAMGEAFGKGFQYGKRKISSMSNEEFNALDFKGLSESIATDYKVMIPSITKSIEASDELQRAVFKALADVIKSIPTQILDFFGDLGNTNRPTTAPPPPTHLGEDLENIDTGGLKGGTAWLLLGISTVADIWHYLGVGNTEFKKLYHPNAEKVLQIKTEQALINLKRQLITSGAYDRYLNRQTTTVTETFTELNKNQAARAELKVLQATLTKLNQRIKVQITWKKNRVTFLAKQQSLLNALVKAKRSYAQIRKTQLIVIKYNKLVKESTREISRLQELINKTKAFIKTTKERL